MFAESAGMINVLGLMAIRLGMFELILFEVLFEITIYVQLLRKELIIC